MIMLNKVTKLFEDSNSAFLQQGIDLILSGVSERCLCGAFMTQIRYELDKTDLSTYYADIEYNRNFGGSIKTIINGQNEIVSITCDLIVHSRGENIKQDNLLAIEMKRNTHLEDEKTKDRHRLIALTKPTYDENSWSNDGTTLPRHVCGYVLGIFYEINSALRQIIIEYYVLGELNRSITVEF